MHFLSSISYIWILLCKVILWTHTHNTQTFTQHDDVIKWKHFLCYWPFVWGIHRSPANSPHKGQWHGALTFLWSVPWINGCVNNREAGVLTRDHAHYDVIVMTLHRLDNIRHIRNLTAMNQWVVRSCTFISFWFVHHHYWHCCHQKYSSINFNLHRNNLFKKYVFQRGELIRLYCTGIRPCK